MTKTVGVTFASHYGVDENWLEQNGVFNPTLEVDAPLFIDPFLLPDSRHKEFSDCAFTAYEAHFEHVLRLLRLSASPGDKAWKAALAMFQFGEAKGMGGTCLGYSAKSGNGRGFGRILSNRALVWAKDVVDLGVKDPELFSSLSLFEGGIGPDLISDMVANIALDCILDFNVRIHTQISTDLGLTIPRQPVALRDRQPPLPINPFSKEPVILLSTDILKHLPLLDDPLGLAGIANHNSSLRDRVNEHIGEIFKIRTKKEKDDIKARAMEDANAFQALLDLMKIAEKTPYDIAKDPQGLVQWAHHARDTVNFYKLKLVDDPSLSPLERINRVCQSIIEKFTALVENNRLWRVFYVDGKPRPEKFAQLLFFAIASAYCDANNLDISPESDAGAGPVDFKLSSGADKVVVEIKLSTNSKILEGYKKQLDAYAKAEKASLGHYVLIDVGRIGNAWQRLQDMRRSNPEFSKKNMIHLIDGTQRPSASKLTLD